MKTITPEMDAHLAGALTSLCTCWKITRQDGVVLGFTDHDQKLTIDGVTYVASSGFMRSAISNSGDTSVDNLEATGFLDDDTISEQDLMNHAYDYADVEVFSCNWLDLTQGIIRLRAGKFGESVRGSSGLFKVQLRGLLQLLEQTVGRTIVPECDTDLGNPVTCTVKLIPDERIANAFYNVGDRIIFPVNGVGRAIRAPLLNPSFEEAESSTIFGWSLTNAIASNLPPYLAPDGTGYLKPTGSPNTGSAFQEVSFIGDATTLDSVKVKQYQIAAGWEARIVVEILDINGDPDTTINGSWLATTVGVWTQRTLDCGDADITVHGYTIKIEWRPTPPTTPTGPAQVLFDNVEVVTNAVEEPPALYNPSFELDFADIGSVSHWGGGVGPTRRIGNINLQPQNGQAYLRLSPFAGTTQVVLIADTPGMTTAEVDAGGVEAQIRGWAGAEEWGYEYRVTLKFFSVTTPGNQTNENDDLISSITTGYIEARPERLFVPFTLRGEIPPLTRSIRVELEGVPGSRQGSTQQKVVFDNLFLDMFSADFEENRFDDYGGLEFEATVAGFTADTAPTFDQDLGDTTVDGEVTWQAVAPAFTFLGEVQTVADHTHFTISGAESAPDNWFQFGVVFFLTGRNANRAIEVNLNTQSTGAIETALPLLWPPEVGDLIRISAGCDKSPEMCFGKFNNILNYQGFPNVPGTDEYFTIGGLGT